MVQIERIETKSCSGMARVLAVRTGWGFLVAVVAGAFLAWLVFLAWLMFEGVAWLVHIL